MYIKSPQIRFKCKLIFINYTLYSLKYNTHDVLYVIVFDSLVALSQLQHSMKDKMVQQLLNNESYRNPFCWSCCSCDIIYLYE